MPLLDVAGSDHFYRVDGADDRPALVFSHSLGLDHAMWDVQAAEMLPYFRILRYDVRGHGASAATPGDYTIAQLGNDVLAIANACGIAEFAFCGLSLGGMIGQWLAVHARDRVTSLVLANTTARVADPAAMFSRTPARKPYLLARYCGPPLM